jgi:LuxR family maltose regulon positive regulatory protein
VAGARTTHIGAALAPLKRALTLTEAEGYVRAYVDEGEPMRDLLRHAVTAGISTGYARRLLSAFGEPLRSTADRRGASLEQPLTVRELEVLCLVAVGMRIRRLRSSL